MNIFRRLFRWFEPGKCDEYFDPAEIQAEINAQQEFVAPVAASAADEPSSQTDRAIKRASRKNAKRKT